jgi:hypothetical protein
LVPTSCKTFCNTSDLALTCAMSLLARAFLSSVTAASIFPVSSVESLPARSVLVRSAV